MVRADLARMVLTLMIVALILLLIPKVRHNERTLAAACVLVFSSLWIDKGLCMVVGGFIPSPLGTITRYVPTLPEMTITLGVWAIGALMVTVFYKIALSVEIARETPTASPYEFAARSAVAGHAEILSSPGATGESHA